MYSRIIGTGSYLPERVLTGAGADSARHGAKPQSRLVQLKARYPDVKLTADDWKTFLLNYSVEVDTIPSYR
jgi:hypothetical protein